MIIYSDKISRRTKYTFEFLFDYITNEKILFTDNIVFFNESTEKLKIEYNTIKKTNNYYLYKDLFIDSTLIEVVNTKNITLNNCIFLFGNNTSFDIISSAFYLLSRYEEYFENDLDNHNRYKYINSVAYKYNFLDKLMINRYIFFIKNLFEIRGNSKINNKINNIISFDIDIPFYYENQFWIYKYIKKTKAFFDNKLKFDNIDYILSIVSKYNYNDDVIFFVLCNKNPSKINNRNIREKIIFKNLIFKLKKISKIGIHLSYNSLKKNIFKEEIEWLSNLLNEKIISNRFHFLKYTIQELLINFKDNKLFYDFSMGYSQISGFRASTNLPFFLYDLKEDKPSNILITPFCMMDTTYRYQYTKDSFLDTLEIYEKEKENFGGANTYVLHNDSMNFELWRSHLIHIFDKSNNNI